MTEGFNALREMFKKLDFTQTIALRQRAVQLKH